MQDRIIGNSDPALRKELIKIISETNGLSITDTLDLLISSDLRLISSKLFDSVVEFRDLIADFHANHATVDQLLKHPVSHALYDFFLNFPIKFKEEHIHLTGALTAEFLFPKLKPLLEGPNAEVYKKKITEVYGEWAWPIKSVADVDRLIRLKPSEGFTDYLKILYLPKLIFNSKAAHIDAAYHMASELYTKYNVGQIRLKFSLSRSSSSSDEQIPGLEDLTPEDTVIGLYEGFRKFQNENPSFKFILSPSFRKESHHFDSSKYKSRKEHFMAQVNEIVAMLDKYPFLQGILADVDTVGDERALYRKEHFNELQTGFRKLQYRGIKIRSHHGETWNTLKKGIQAVDNAMNIWHIDTLEHGISLGINPNKYFHQIFQRVLELNGGGQPLTEKHPLYREVSEMDWVDYNRPIFAKLVAGEKLNETDKIAFVKAKFHTAREVEHYQHDVLNRMIQKGVTLVALPSSNTKLTGKFEDYKEHPFSWWEKKGVQLGVGTDNYVTLNTDFIKELLILMYTDPQNLKIMKLLMVTTGETRRPYMSHLLWRMRKSL